MRRATTSYRKHSRGFETLETRMVMAGNVTVTAGLGPLNHPTINIIGDTASNHVQVLPGAGFNIYRIVGLVDADTNTATTINGQNEFILDLSATNDRQYLNIDLDQGDDQLLIEGTNFGGAFIYGGSGDDTINIGEYVPITDPGSDEHYSVFSDLVQIIGLTGNDTISVNRFYDLEDDVKLIVSGQSSGESQHVKIDLYMVFANSVLIYDGAGSGEVSLGYVATSTDCSVYAGPGDDLVSFYASNVGGITTVFGGNGSDFLALDVNKYDNNVNIYGDGINYPGNSVTPSVPGDDTVLLSRSVFDDSQLSDPLYVNIYMDEGTDTVLIGKYYDEVDGDVVLKNAGSVFSNLSIDLGNGNDSGQIATNVIEQFYLSLGGNDDSVDLESNVLTNWFFYGDYNSQLGTFVTGHDRLRRYNNSIDPSLTNQLSIEENLFGAF